VKLIRAFLFLLMLSTAVVAQTANPQELFNAAVAAQEHGDYAKAVDLYRRLVKISPEVPAGWINLGVALINLGKYREAADSLREARALDPGNRQIAFALSLALYKNGDFSEAAGELDRIEEAEPDNVRVAALLADCELHLGKPRDALKLLEPLAGNAARHDDFSFIYGSVLIANGKLQQGATILEEYGAANRAAEAYFAAADALLRLNLSERGLVDLQAAAAIRPNLPGLYTKLGQALEKNADFSDAAAAYRKATEENRKDLAAWIGLGANLYSLRDLPGAKAAIEQALRLDPSSVDARYTMALVEKSEGELAPAVSDLQAVVKARPEFMPAHAELAALYFRLHRPQEGRRERQVVDQLASEQRSAGPK
jgi:tetratricopeptide (TPR) repeat protein